MIERKEPRYGKIGIFGVAHGIYWNQFEGLEEKIMKHHDTLCRKLEQMGAEVENFGMVDSSEKAYAATKKINGSDIDLLFCNMTTYATSSVFAPIIRDCPVPVVLVALQPEMALDTERACTEMQLENDNICSVPEFCGVAIRMNRKVQDVILGCLTDDTEADNALREWCNIACVLHSLKGARIGLMGHVLEAMYDMHTDPTAVLSAFGVHVPLLEMDDMMACFDEATDAEIQQKIALIQQEFLMPDPKSDPITRKLTEEDLHQSAHAAVALDRLIKRYRLNGLAYYYEGREGSLQRKLASSLIVGNSILNAQGIPMCGEFDLKTCIAMLIMDRLDIGGSFAEFHPFDFNSNIILVGHDGPHHLKIADGKPILRSLKQYHGKPGAGASVEFQLKEGPITMLGITQTANGVFRLVIGEGESQRGPIPPTGNTNTRGVFGTDTKDFVKRWCMEGPTHHYALGIGHHADTIVKIANVLHLDSVVVK